MSGSMPASCTALSYSGTVQPLTQSPTFPRPGTITSTHPAPASPQTRPIPTQVSLTELEYSSKEKRTRRELRTDVVQNGLGLSDKGIVAAMYGRFERDAPPAGFACSSIAVSEPLKLHVRAPAHLVYDQGSRVMLPPSLRAIVVSPRCVAGGVVHLVALAGRSTSPRGMSGTRLDEATRPARPAPSVSGGSWRGSAFGQDGVGGHAPHRGQGPVSGQGACGAACGKHPCPNTALKRDWRPAGFARQWGHRMKAPASAAALETRGGVYSAAPYPISKTQLGIDAFDHAVVSILEAHPSESGTRNGQLRLLDECKLKTVRGFDI